jgi:hypothetical protein
LGELAPREIASLTLLTPLKLSFAHPSNHIGELDNLRAASARVHSGVSGPSSLDHFNLQLCGSSYKDVGFPPAGPSNSNRADTKVVEGFLDNASSNKAFYAKSNPLNNQKCKAMTSDLINMTCGN